MRYNFLYQDQRVSQQVIDGYIVGNVIHENGYVTCSTLRGGMLTNTNLRYLFITNIGGEFLLVDEDWRKQGLFIFSQSLYYDIYDKYQAGNYTQILLSPDRYIENIDDVIKAARRDFNQLLRKPPIAVLDTKEWRSRFTHPLGKDGKNAPHSLGI